MWSGTVSKASTGSLSISTFWKGRQKQWWLMWFFLQLYHGTRNSLPKFVPLLLFVFFLLNLKTNEDVKCVHECMCVIKFSEERLLGGKLQLEVFVLNTLWIYYVYTFVHAITMMRVLPLLLYKHWVYALLADLYFTVVYQMKPNSVSESVQM